MACSSWVLFSEVSLCLLSSGDDCQLQGGGSCQLTLASVAVLVELSFEGRPGSGAEGGVDRKLV